MSSTTASTNATVKPALYGALEYRNIGPHRGGRVVAVAGDPNHRQTFHFGSTSGGVWKTIGGGVTWRNVSDGYFRAASVGVLTVHDDNVREKDERKSKPQGRYCQGQQVGPGE